MKTKRRLIPIVLIICLSLLSVYRLLRPGFLSLQDDMHVFRLQEFHQCLIDGQIPCRYSTTASFNYGSPIFNFYPPLSYIIPELFHLLGFSLADSIKLLLIFSAVIRGLGMYFLAGPVAAILYIFAPYQALNTFVRGAIAENLALSLLPWLILSLKYKRFASATLFSTLLLLTHQLSIIAFLPIIAGFCLIEKISFKKLITISTLSLGLSSFFLLPSIFERGFTTNSTMFTDYFDYHLHFVSLYQIFISRFWGYGASNWGIGDGMGFTIGQIQFIIPFLLFLFSPKKIKLKIIPLLGLALFFLFLTHQRSTFIWQAIPFLAFFQFPWRFIGPAVFLFSYASGLIKINRLFIILIAVLAITSNINFFHEDLWYKNPDFLTQKSESGFRDFWPKSGNQFPDKPAPATTDVSNFSKTSNQINFTSNFDKPTLTELPLVYFPGWKATINLRPASIIVNPDLGQINLDIPAGKNQINLTFADTPIRKAGNIISLGTLVIILITLLPL
ncbi:MAG: hypothetical protein WCV93_02225 [Candidatus Shapirobacteria bacterium]